MKYTFSIALLLVLAVSVGCKGCKKDGEGTEDLGDLVDLVLEDCSNGEDDNGDGLADCRDPRCQVTDACVFEPPDPSDLAPPNGSGLTDFSDSVRFLWDGDNPIVRGVDVDALDMSRVSVVRAQLFDRDGNPVTGVRANIGNRPEFGYTFSRADGMVDLVMNGGESAHVRIGGGGYLTIDREVSPERLAYGWADDIVMTPISEKVTPVDFKKRGQMAVGEAEQDESGERTARMYFPPGTVATAVLPDGQRGVLDNAKIRLTEYTVGDTGLSAMPAGLPDETAYTYAIELSVDEARNAGATSVEFSEPVYLYLDNFLEFELGTAVPSGFYLRNAVVWEPSPNGIVMQKTADGVSIADGATADKSTRDELGLTGRELDVIDEMFEVGETFWRVPVEHFSPCDLNWPYEFPEDAVPPDDIPDFPTTDEDDPCLESGSRIECQNQVVSKSIDLPGAPLDLVYRSDRVAGSGRTLEFPITNDNPPSTMEKIVVIVELAGQVWRTEYEPEPNLVHVVEWDGLDAYGREASGKWPVRVSIGHYYEISYTSPPPSERAFAQAGGAVVGAGRRILPMWRVHRELFGTFDALETHGLGGWSFDQLHAYDASREIYYPGDSPERKASGVGRVIRLIERFSDSSNLSFDPQQFVSGNVGVDVGPDDSLYVRIQSVGGANAIIRRYPNGELKHVGGRLLDGQELVAQGCHLQGCDIDGPATEAVLPGNHFHLDDDGTPYIGYGTCIFAIREGSVELLDDCQSDERPEGSDDLPGSMNSFVVTDGGEVVMASNSGIYRLEPETGFVEKLAGCSADECEEISFSPRPGTSVDLRPDHLTVAPNGDIYFKEGWEDAVAILDRAGNVRLEMAPTEGYDLRALNFGRNGRLYAYRLEELAARVAVRVGKGWNTLAGADFNDLDPTSDIWSAFAEEGEPIPSTSATILPLGQISANSNGSVFIGTLGENPVEDAEVSVIPAIQEISSVFPDVVVGVEETLLPSATADRLFRFDATGRHVETIDAVTLAPLRTFQRDATGHVTSVTDGNGNVTVVERDNGDIAAVVGPWGHRVEFATDEDGYITEIQMPDGSVGTVGLGHEGLMETWTDPRGEVSTYEYSPIGRLIRAEDPAGGWKELTRLRSGRVELETASGRESTYGYVDQLTGESVLIDARGLEWRTREIYDQWTETTRPDGTVTRTVMRADPRFGLLASYVGERTTTLPSGLEQVRTMRREFTSSDPNDLTSLQSLRETMQIGDDQWTLEFDVPSRTLTKTSAAGRVAKIGFDDQMRIISEQIGDFSPVEYDYDDQGRIVTMRQEGEEANYTFGDDGFVDSIVGPGGELTVEHDSMGRVVSYDDGLSEHGATYDVRGDVISSDMAGGYSYTRQLNSVRLPTEFSVPDGSSQTSQWDLDRRLQSIVGESGRQVSFERDTAGRLLAIDTPAGRHTRAYDDTTGQLTRATSPDVTTDLSYDGMLVTERNFTLEGESVRLQRSFTDDFEIARRTVAGSAVDFAYDADGNYTSVGPVEIAHLDGVPIPEVVTVGDVQTTITYDSRGMVAAVEHEGPGGPLFSEQLTESAGRATSIDESVLGTPTSREYSYDAAGHLLTVTKDGVASGDYAYDVTGQRTSIDGQAVSHDAAGRTVSVGATSYGWDDDGFLATIDDGTLATFTHGALGHLRRAELDGKVVEYRYGPRANRVARIVDGTIDALWIYDETSRPVAQLDASGDVVARFVYATSGMVPDAMLRNGRTYRLIRDRRYSVRLVVDAATGQVEQQLEYGPLGEILTDTNPGFQPFGFAGGMHDPHTGFTHMGRRDYDPVSGRWTTPDPGGFSDLSTGLYQYGLGDPINYIDPDGEAVWLLVLVPVVIASAATASWNNQAAIVNNSSRKARAVYWGEGGSAGPQNQLRHCTGQCDYSREYGTFLAKVTADWHELPVDLPNAGGSNNTLDDPDNGVDVLADRLANQCGRELAEEGPPERDCVELCQDAIESGRLPVPHKSHWKNDNGNLDVRVRRGMKMVTQQGGM